MDENLIKRIPPNSPEAEKSVLGAMLLDGDALIYATEHLTEGDFYNPGYSMVFKGLSDLAAKNRNVDTVTLLDHLKELGAPDELREVSFLSELARFVPSPSMINDYCRIVLEHATVRRLIKACEEIANRGYLGKDEADDQLQQAEKDIFDVLQKRTETEFTPISQVVLDTIDLISKAAKTGDVVNGIATGFADLDAMTSGFQPANLVLIAARPAMGKTALVLNIAEHAAVKKKHKVAIFSLEMNKEELMKRFLAMGSRVSSDKLRRASTLEDTDWELLMETGGEIGNSGLMMFDTPNLNINELRSICRKLKLDVGLDMVIIDYLQLMSAVRASSSRQQDISDISRGLKVLARELDIPVIALSQLSREVEKRNDHKPVLSDLRESGAIEQDADIVMFIFREEVYTPTPENHNLAELIIAKHRNGAIGSVDLVWQPEYTRFGSREWRDEK